jgi:hypothetical protein
MKRFITAMIFSLTVIVCEQQTLFAPHYTDFGGRLAANVTVDDYEILNLRGTTHSLVPVAGVNRLIPVALSFTTPVDDSNSCGVMGCSRKYARNHESYSHDGVIVVDVDDPGDADLTGPIGGTLDRTSTVIDPNDCSEIVDPYLRPFLSWHRG